MTDTYESILQKGEPSRTALRVATLRAAHQLLDEPVLLEDPIALPILGTTLEAAVREDPYQYNEPFMRGLRALLVVRSRVAEDELARAVAAGVQQYVVLGAGLDTFAYRNPHSAAGLRVFEVDHPSTQQWKRNCLSEAGIVLPGNLTFAPVDFEHGTLAQGLAEVGFRNDLPACFSWLGVTMYLTEATIMDTLGYVAALAKGSSICFDYRVSATLLNPIERMIGELMGQRVAAAGEAWLSAFEPEVLQKQMLAQGFSEADTYDAEILNQRYLYRRKDGLRTSGRVMCARV